ncbi:hypothetical protein SAY86_031390 [Trapa natans]|uniref:RIN4 pathogenic type III effector avirulence factor Avr cleavage site domain-containing protein n=1 Tax=Trapa natans TaxID=22666 RepID=A0AAN7LRV1_TRANT|nr:hypothetical protein SAY86_031390 [Trapa natans]
MAVPQFGGWDHKSPESTNYSVVFSQARANRKHHKSGFGHKGLGEQREVLHAAAYHQRKEDPQVV